MQMNFPVKVLPSESVVLIRLPRREVFVYWKDAFCRSWTEASSEERVVGGSELVVSVVVAMVGVSGSVCVVGIAFKICSSQQSVLMNFCGLAVFSLNDQQK